jgi:hypothetical protein
MTFLLETYGSMCQKMSSLKRMIICGQYYVVVSSFWSKLRVVDRSFLG